MKYDHNQICTTSKEIEVGRQYDYSEEYEKFRVVVLADNSNEEMLEFTLKMLSEPKGKEFTVSAARGNYAYNGMWRLWNAGEYLRGEYSEEDYIPDGRLIGYSLSKCICQILRNDINLDRIEKIITGTAADDESRWDRLIKNYTNYYWSDYGDKGREVVMKLIKDGKIFQPRIGDPGEMKDGVIWEKA